MSKKEKTQGRCLRVFLYDYFNDYEKLLKTSESLNLKSSGNSYIPRLLLIIALRFTCSERKIW